MADHRHVLVLATIVVTISRLAAQSPVDFDVVSIKKNTAATPMGGGRTLPDGTMIMVNMPIRALVGRFAMEPIRDVEGLPSWAMDGYDVTVKPPADLKPTRDQQSEMWRRMLADRFKLKAHVDHRQQDGFALVLARDDGKLGPNLKPSLLDCSAKPGAAPPPPSTTRPTTQEVMSRSGGMTTLNSMLSGERRSLWLPAWSAGFLVLR